MRCLTEREYDILERLTEIVSVSNAIESEAADILYSISEKGFYDILYVCDVLSKQSLYSEYSDNITLSTSLDGVLMKYSMSLFEFFEQDDIVFYSDYLRQARVDKISKLLNYVV